jgi:hypothetical protein
MRRFGAVMLLFAILACGVGIGISVGRVLWGPVAAPRTSEERTARLVERFRRELDLAGEQARVVAEALRRSRAETEDIRRRIEPELRAVRDRARSEIAKVLAPAQREKFREIVERYEARRAGSLSPPARR